MVAAWTMGRKTFAVAPTRAKRTARRVMSAKLKNRGQSWKRKLNIAGCDLTDVSVMFSGPFSSNRLVMGVALVMKKYLTIATVVAATMLTCLFASCANQSDATNTAASNANPTDRTYTRTDLSRTGRNQTSEAIQAVEPSASSPTGR